MNRLIPSEIGDLVELRELMLNNNLLRALPTEIGKLFQLLVSLASTTSLILVSNYNIENKNMRSINIFKFIFLQNLGLKGNQLSLEISSIYNEPNGTRKLLDYMLDNMSGKPSSFRSFSILLK